MFVYSWYKEILRHVLAQTALKRSKHIHSLLIWIGMRFTIDKYRPHINLRSKRRSTISPWRLCYHIKALWMPRLSLMHLLALLWQVTLSKEAPPGSTRGTVSWKKMQKMSSHSSKWTLLTIISINLSTFEEARRENILGILKQYIEFDYPF